MKSISGSTFYACRNLTSISVAEGNTVYDSRNGCNAIIETGTNTLIVGCLGTIVPNSVTNIGNSAFEGNRGLTVINIPESVTSIGVDAFAYCSELTSITFHEGLTSIGMWAFKSCEGLTSITLPESVTSIGDYAFYECSNLTSINIPEGVTSIEDRTFLNCRSLTSISFPENVKSIGSEAFSGCYALTSIVLPKNLETVEENAFASCDRLSNVYCYAESVPSLASSAFVNSTIENAILRVPADALDSYKTTMPWSRFGSILAFGEYITDIELSQSSATLIEGESLSLAITLTPEDMDKNLIAWSSSNPSVVAVDNQGKVKAVSSGKATITAKAIDGGEASDSCEVTVLYADYVITYEVDGEVYATDTVTRASAVTPLEEPVKEGYTFSGWSEIPETMPGHDVTVSGTFTINKYLVNFALDGVVISSSSLEYGTAIVPPEVAEREGYTFGGWQNLLETVPANDTTIIGNFLINSYTVTYVVEEEVYHTDTLAFGSQITTIKYPVKEGYTFSGWSETPEFMPAKDLTITGTFSINSYRITYTVDGVEHHTDSIEYGDTIAVIAEPTKEGYTFSGWSEIPETMPANDVSVSGKFTINGYTVTYVVEGEVFHTDTITFGSQITSIKNPVKEGHTFAGWGDVPEFMPAKDLTITGTFIINSYRITYTVDGIEHHTDSIEYGDTIAVIAAPVKEGYSFSGWSEIPETMPANDVSVSGKFTINRYQITYIVGEDVYHTDSIAYGTYITSIKNPVKEGYTFIEWIDIPEQMPASDVTTIGSFSINKYKVTYTADNVTIYTDSIVYGGQIKDIASPTKEGYSFGGWEKNHQTMPAYDVVINGTFTINKYQISYVVGGETIHTDSITYNERITPIESPEQEGFTFSGWIGVPGIMPAYDVTVGGEFFIKNMQTDSQGLMYVLNEETETFELSNYEGNLTGTIVIPADLYGYPVNGVKERALMGAENLIAVVIPENVSSVGYRAFYGCNNLSYIEWETTAPVDAACFDEPARHGNLLVYVKDAATEVTYQGNVIVDGVAERIAITNEQPLRNIREFTARNITFTRQFTKKTERGVAGGWEAMIIPFDVETVTSENRGELKPFGEADFTTSLPYWIAQLQADGSFAYIDSIKANRPFIMEVPNCDEYQDIYNVEGAISFGAENVTVYVTTDMNHDMGNGYTMMGNYEGTASDGYVYALNDEEYAADGDVYLPGGVFVADSRDIRPFEAYIYSNQPTAAPYLRIGKKGATDIDNLLIQRTDDAWYNLQGVRLSGKPTERGVYIINRKKVVID